MTPLLETSTPLVDGDVLPVLGGLEVVHTPGHTPGSVCLYARRDRLLFVGDALQHRFGRVSFASSLYSDDVAEARASVKRMAALDVVTIVFAHYPPVVEGATATLARLAGLAQERIGSDPVTSRDSWWRRWSISSGQAESGSQSDRHSSSVRRFEPERSRTVTSRTSVPRVARVLFEAGLGPGDRAIIWAVNRPEWGLAFLGIAHLGAVAVPLDVRHTVDFGHKIVDQTGAKLVIASRQTEASARALGLPIVVDRIAPGPRPPVRALAARPRRRRRRWPRSCSRAGRRVNRRARCSPTAISCRAPWRCAGCMSISADDRLLSVLPLSHLYEQVLGFMGPLVVGASVVYPVSRQPAVLIRTFRDFRVSMLLIVPQGLQLLTSAIERRVDQADRRDPSSGSIALRAGCPECCAACCSALSSAQFGGRLHTIGVGASALDVDVAQRWIDMGVEILQGYGATEMGPVVTFTRPERNMLGTVGEPLPGIEVKIADDGEILARGPGRFAGYWQNPAATAAAIDADGWYHTGDLGAFTDAGMLTFRGRKKDMLALPDGQKVYPEDVEAVLRLDARVQDATVVGWPLGADLRVHAVLLLEDADAAGAIIRDANDAARAASADPRLHRLARCRPAKDPHSQGPQTRGAGSARGARVPGSACRQRSHSPWAGSRARCRPSDGARRERRRPRSGGRPCEPAALDRSQSRFTSSGGTARGDRGGAWRLRRR